MNPSWVERLIYSSKTERGLTVEIAYVYSVAGGHNSMIIDEVWKTVSVVDTYRISCTRIRERPRLGPHAASPVIDNVDPSPGGHPPKDNPAA